MGIKKYHLSSVNINKMSHYVHTGAGWYIPAQELPVNWLQLQPHLISGLDYLLSKWINPGPCYPLLRTPTHAQNTDLQATRNSLLRIR